MLNRLGHSETYRFILEHETAIAKALQESPNLLSVPIVVSPDAPSVFHSEFDHFNRFLNTLDGQGSVHAAHGITLQTKRH